MQAIATTLIIFAASLLFALAGGFLLKWASPSSPEGHPSRALQIGFGFFIGMDLFLALYRCGALIFNRADVSLAIAATFVCFFAARFIWQGELSRLFSRQDLRSLASFIPLALGAWTLVLLYWSENPMARDGVNAYNAVGTLHSARYVSIAEFIVTANRIPVLGQNYGQSLLATVPLFLKTELPFWALNVWLFASILFFAFLVKGCLGLFSKNSAFQWIGTAIVLMGNTALSLTHILVIDSGSPFLMSGYTDPLQAAGSFLGFLWWLQVHFLAQGPKVPTPTALARASALVLPLGIAWGLTGPQNLPLIFLLLGLLVLYGVRSKRSVAPALSIFALFLIAFMICRYQGGMFTPPSRHETTKIFGVMTIPETRSVISEMHLPHFIAGKAAWSPAMSLFTFTPHTTETLKSILTNFASYASIRSVLVLETVLLQGIRAWFFPLSGVLLCLWLLRTGTRHRPMLLPLALSTALLLAAGFCAAFFIRVNDYKWELSRFLIPGYALGMIAWVVSFHEWTTTRQCERRGLRLFLLMAIFVTFGPTWYLAVNVVDRVRSGRGEAVIREIMSKTEPISALE